MLIGRKLNMSTSKYVSQIKGRLKIFRMYGRDVTIDAEACLWPVNPELLDDQ